jgi:serine/threonine protein kinase
VVLFGGRGKLLASRETYIATMDDTWLFHGGCPTGTFQDVDKLTGSNWCYSCPKGTYKGTDLMGTSTAICTRCPNGTTTKFIGSTNVMDCIECEFQKDDVSHNMGLCVVIGFGVGETGLPSNSTTPKIRPVWECIDQYYGCGGGPDCTPTNVEWGHDCSLHCLCNGLPCSDGWEHGDGQCDCGPFGYWFSREDCATQIWTILIIITVTLGPGALVVAGARAYRIKTNRHRYQRRMLAREKMDLEVSAALLSEQHLREIGEFEDGWNIDEHDLTWVKRLAAGGFGEVWKGKYVAFPGETVAIKKFFLMPDTIETIMERGAFADQEVTVLAKTPAHRNIVFVIGAGQLHRSKEIFLVSEFMPGGDLRDLLNGGVGEEGIGGGGAEGKANASSHARRKSLAWCRRVQIARDVAEGMAFLHERGLIHRDLKSLNILLEAGPTGKAKIADFGLSKFTGSHNAILRQCSAVTADEAAEALLREESRVGSRHSNYGDRDGGRDGGGGANAGRATRGAFNELEEVAHQLYLGFTSASAPWPASNVAFDLKTAVARGEVCPNWLAEYKNDHNKVARREGVFTGHDAVVWLMGWLERQGNRKCRTLDASLLGSKLLQAGYFQYIRTIGACESSYDKLLDDNKMLYMFNSGRLGNEEQGSDSSGGSGARLSGASTSTLSNPLTSRGSEQPRRRGDGTTSGGRGFGSESGSSLGASPFQTQLTANMGSLFWMAPEVLGQRGGKAVYGLATDVYSFGIMLYELVTRRYPWDDLEEPLQLRILTKVLGGERPTLTREEELRAGVFAKEEGGALLLDLMRRAWLQDAQARPTFDAMAKLLAKAMATLPEAAQKR